MNSSIRKLALITVLGALLVVCVLAGQPAEAGCPFDDGSCQEYCSQQGCNLGYCGHFAWIQCICRKCGDEWNWYDKVHYNPDKQVNQTELDSLKLNGSAPLILTNVNAQRRRQQQQAPPKAVQQQVPAVGQPEKQVKSASVQQQPAPAKQVATLTTLLIPDLSDGSKLDLNDIPDENSEKFLDYLAKNHEKLVQATSGRQQQQKATQSSMPSDESTDESTENEGDDSEADSQQPQVTRPSTSASDGAEAETVEIQISSSNNQPQPLVVTTNNNRQQPLVDDDEQQQRHSSGPMTRLLKMAVAERLSDDII